MVLVYEYGPPVLDTDVGIDPLGNGEVAIPSGKVLDISVELTSVAGLVYELPEGSKTVDEL